MPDDELKIRVTGPGARRTEGDLRKVAEGEKAVGRAGKQAGKDVKDGADKGKEGLEDLGSAAGVNVRAFMNWKIGAGLAIAAVIGMIKRAEERLREFSERMAQTYRQYVDLTRQAQTVNLAGIRGETPTATVAWMRRKAAQYGIAPEAARGAAFEIESALPKALWQPTEEAGFQAMAVKGATGATMAGLAIAGYGAGVARTPQAMRAFFARASQAADTSRVSIEQLGQLASRYLPAAVKAGIDPDYFLAQVGAMSMREPRPDRLGTAIEQMIRAAGQTSPPLEAFAAESGRTAAQLSAAETMEFQGRYLAGAMKGGGPQAAAAAAEALGIAPEIGSVYARLFGPGEQERMRATMPAIGAATWAGGIDKAFRGLATTPEFGEFTARTAAETAGFEAARTQSGLAIAYQVAAARYQRRYRGGLDLPVGISPKQMTERLTTVVIAEALDAMIAAGGMPEDVARQAELIEFRLGDRGGELIAPTRRRYTAAAQFIINHGGTQYITADKRDPAGKPRTPAGRH